MWKHCFHVLSCLPFPLWVNLNTFCEGTLDGSYLKVLQLNVSLKMFPDVDKTGKYR